MNDRLFNHRTLILNPASRSASYLGKDIVLSPREFAILQALVERPGVPVSRMQLRERLYGANEPRIVGNPVQVHIHNLRAKLGDDVIRTVRHLGYMIDKEMFLPPALPAAQAATSASA